MRAEPVVTMMSTAQLLPQPLPVTIPAVLVLVLPTITVSARYTSTLRPFAAPATFPFALAAMKMS